MILTCVKHHDKEALRIREQELARREKALKSALEDHIKNSKTKRNLANHRSRCSILRIIEEQNNKIERSNPHIKLY